VKFDSDGRKRVIVEGLAPEIDGGRFPAKRIAGDVVEVRADIFTDGHDRVAAHLLHRSADETEWHRSPMRPLVNDRWEGSFEALATGRYVYTVEAWVDHFLTWHRDLRKRVAAGEESLGVQFLIGAAFAERAAERASGDDAARLREAAATLSEEGSDARKLALAFDDAFVALIERYPDLTLATRYPRELEIVVDRQRAEFSTWYELFPRSAAGDPGRHGTFRDVIARLPYVASMGFDVLYLPPIHPIGRSHRKGPNNSTVAGAGDPGSPWAIGAEEGGHTSIHPELGTVEDFRQLVREASEHGIEIALDIAFQASPDHPWVDEHPEWFLRRPDGTVQYAENPPKKYQDIYPFHFESDAWQSLWKELRDVFLHWIGEGIRIFRVDNPHTKPLPFWEWVIGEIRRDHPDVIFLAEAFTRPRVMYYLAKGGFTQSYTYFAWRNTSWEITDYFSELTQSPAREFFRPNAWPNTPDILPEHLQYGGRPAFVTRLILAATLSSNYGVYGPAFELGESAPREPGSEEYLDSEKYQIRQWNLDDDRSISEIVALVNRIRRENPALQWNRTLRFHRSDNEQVIAFSKTSRDGSNTILTVVNVDPSARQSAWIDLWRDEFSSVGDAPLQIHDLLTGARHSWRPGWHQVDLDPHGVPARIFRVRRRVRTEHDFDYFM
jgi:starch synthase (maltosyl-transferring)